MAFLARYAGQCAACGQWFSEGTVIEAEPGETSADGTAYRHAQGCPPRFGVVGTKAAEERREARRKRTLERRRRREEG